MKIEISKTLKTKPYYWYFYNSLKHCASDSLVEIDMPVNEPYIELCYFDGTPVFVDLRDDLAPSATYRDFSAHSIILKANYSTELYDNPPVGFEYDNPTWLDEVRPQMRPFMLGRTCSPTTTYNDLHKYFSRDIPIHKVVSYSGEGLTQLSTDSRLKVYQLIHDTFPKKSDLRFIHKSHFKGDIKDTKFNYTDSMALEDYYKFLSTGQYILNFPGIAGSQPFRIVDAVMVGRGCVSTKIYHDLYKSFPCIQLPICGYTGIGDWKLAKTNLQLATIDGFSEKSRIKTREWYSWFFSADGMFKNQIMVHLK